MSARRFATIAAIAILLLGIGCSTPSRGAWHVVQPGENLYRIARYYGVHVEEILESNRVYDVTDIRVGTELWIPGAGSVRAPLGPLTPPPDVLRDIARNDVKATTRAGDFGWPVLGGELTSRYGPRWGRMHQGIDIGARSGTPIRSAGDGVVSFSSRLGGYGNVVIVKHGDGVATVYAHNRRNRVKKGTRVQKGDVIAEVGQSGNATGPHLHFEVRKDDRHSDPLRYLR
jgi:murein DD-endopeptidase MepM/ murein hydrolase activator NlpD